MENRKKKAKKKVRSVPLYDLEDDEPKQSAPMEGDTVTYRTVFHDLEGTRLYYPLDRIALQRPLGPLRTSELKYISHLHLSGLEQLTDLWFYVVCHEIGSSSLKLLQAVDFSGCIHLTDRAVYWFTKEMGKSQNDLQTISFKGCKQITAYAMMTILKQWPKLNNLNLSGTSVDTTRLLTTDYNILKTNLTGCPIVTHSTKSDKELHLELKRKDPKPWLHTKVLFVVQPDKETVLDKVLRFDNYGNNQFKIWKHKEHTFRCLEAPIDICSRFVSDRCIVVIPIADYKAKPYIMDVLRHMLAAVDGNRIVFILSGLNSKAARLSELVMQLVALPKSKAGPFNEMMVADVMSKLRNMDFKNQQNQGHRLYQMNLFTEELHVLVSPMEKDALGDVLLEAEERLQDSLCPMYKEIDTGLEQIIAHENNAFLIDHNLKYLTKEMFGSKLDVNESTMMETCFQQQFKFLHKMGVVYLCSSNMDDYPGYIISDFESLCKHVTKLNDAPSQNKQKFYFLHPETKYWTTEDLEELEKRSNIELTRSTRSHIIEEFRLGYYFKMFEILVMFDKLIDYESGAVNVEKFWTMQPTDSLYRQAVSFSTTFYNKAIEHYILFNICTSIDSNMIDILCLTKTVILVRDNGILIFIEVLIQSPRTTITITAETMKSEENQHHYKIMYRMLAKYKMLIEHSLQHHKCDYNVKEEIENKMVNLDDVTGLSGHCHDVETEEAGEKTDQKSQIVPYPGTRVTCKQCGIEQNIALAQWSWYKTLYPSFAVEQFYVRSKALAAKEWEPSIYDFEHVHEQGNMFSGDSRNCFVSACLNTWDNNEVSFTPFNEDAILGVSTHNDRQSPEDQILWNIALGHLNIEEGLIEMPSVVLGYTIKFRFTMNVDNHDMVTIDITMNGIPVKQLQRKSKSYYPVYSLTHRGNMIIGFPKTPRSTHDSAAGINVGMKVEAWDRKTPTYVCAATIANIRENHVLLHFDGWKGYDYWAPAHSDCFHPLGWHEQYGSTLDKYLNTLNPPKFLGKGEKFTWESYLELTNSKPAPHSWFSKFQTDGCESIIPDDHPHGSFIEDTIPDLRLDDCGFVNSVYSNNMFEKLIRSDQALRRYIAESEFSSEADSFPLACLLPSTFKREHLKFVTQAHTLDFNKQKLHFLCSGNVKEMHLVACDGIEVDAKDIQQLLKYICLSSICMLRAKNCFPMGFQNLIEESDEVALSLPEMADGIAKILRLYVQTIVMMEPTIGFDLVREDLEFSVKNNTLHVSVAEGKRDSVFKQQTVTKSSAKYVLSKLWTTAQDDTGIGGELVLSETDSELHLEDHIECNNFMCRFHNKSGTDYTALYRGLEMYGHLITELRLDNSKMEAFDKSLFHVSEITVLSLSNNTLTTLPTGFHHFTRLHTLDLHNNQISTGVEFIGELQSLVYLDLSNNPLDTIPDATFNCKQIKTLKLVNDGLWETPASIGTLKLVELNLSENPIKLDSSLVSALGSQKSSLQKLNLSGVPWIMNISHGSQKSLLTEKQYNNYIRDNYAFKKLIEENFDPEELFNQCDVKKQKVLELGDSESGINKLNGLLYQLFPRFEKFPWIIAPGYDPAGPHKATQNFTSLNILELKCHSIENVPEEISYMTDLTQLDLSHNSALQTLPASMGNMKLKSLHLRGCTSMKTPPMEVVSRGFVATMGYMKRLALGSAQVTRTKLMLVGLGGAGKTSLVRAIMSEDLKTSGTTAKEVTDGIDICKWKVQSDETEITYNIWDFAGQTVYYNTHQFFLSNRAVYLLLWNVRLGYEHSGLNFWLNSIGCHAPKAPIFVIGTHIDQVEKALLPAEEMEQKYPQIKGFHYVSSHTGMGMEALVNDILEVTLQQKYMGERSPVAWLKLENKINTHRSTTALLQLKDVQAIGEDVGVMVEELDEALQFLHDLGSLQYFSNDYLRNNIIINPQWIVDVMAGVVSVKTNLISDGRLHHSDLGSIWPSPKYRRDLIPWLLRLTEEYDLTFALKDSPISLVPCLLPNAEPEFTWPPLEEGRFETSMIYEFDYLPPGLFNRAQVRLYQYCDGSIIWKKGSFLKKNTHIAILRQSSNTKVHVKAQGPRPENMLFSVHEVFESLVAESFHGVQYDFYVPCIDCIKEGIQSPCMFSGSHIRRAIQLKATFIQCSAFFHALSIKEMQACLPPDDNEDFALHLNRTMQQLTDLRSSLANDTTLIIYNSSDYTTESQVTPKKIAIDLRSRNITVYEQAADQIDDVQSAVTTMTESQVVTVLMTDDFVTNKECKKWFYYIHGTLKKPILLVLTTSGRKWQQSGIGIQVDDQVFVNMSKEKNYDVKLKELVSTLQMKFAQKKDKPELFLSYCWSNSSEAIAKGSRSVDGALGVYDPRDLKRHIEKKSGMTCWLDIEQTGKEGLFKDISDGIKNAKLIVACVSDEYVKSVNCAREFRYAAVTLKLPVILAVVGTGFSWTMSEIGMLSWEFPKFSFQHQNHNSMDQLLSEIDKYKTTQAEKEAKNKDDQKANESQEDALKEVIELAQRKFLRQLTTFSQEFDSEPYPRLVLLDFSDSKPEEGEESHQKMKMKSMKFAGTSKRPPRQDTSDIPEVNTSVYMGKKLGFRFLCEYERGWHSAGDLIPWHTTAREGMLGTWAPYLSHIMSILRNMDIDIACLQSDRAAGFIQYIEQSNVAMSSDLKTAYASFSKAVTEFDQEKTKGNLSRCHLPSGKVLWLCSEHQDDSHITVMSSQAPSNLQFEGNEISTKVVRPKSAKAEEHKTKHNTRAKGLFIGAALAVEKTEKYAKYARHATQNSRKDNQSVTDNKNSDKEKTTPKRGSTSSAKSISSAGGMTREPSSTSSNGKKNNELDKKHKAIADIARDSPTTKSKACVIA